MLKSYSSWKIQLYLFPKNFSYDFPCFVLEEHVSSTSCQCNQSTSYRTSNQSSLTSIPVNSSQSNIELEHLVGIKVSPAFVHTHPGAERRTGNESGAQYKRYQYTKNCNHASEQIPSLPCSQFNICFDSPSHIKGQNKSIQPNLSHLPVNSPHQISPISSHHQKPEKYLLSTTNSQKNNNQSILECIGVNLLSTDNGTTVSNSFGSHRIDDKSQSEKQRAYFTDSMRLMMLDCYINQSIGEVGYKQFPKPVVNRLSKELGLTKVQVKQWVRNKNKRVRALILKQLPEQSPHVSNVGALFNSKEISQTFSKQNIEENIVKDEPMDENPVVFVLNDQNI